MNDRPIELILDTSAVLAYNSHLLDVGETLAEVADEDAVVGVPLLCLVEAAHRSAAMAVLELLAHNPSVEVLADDPTEWQSLAAMLGIVGELGAASGALAAVDFDCQVLTRAPELYERMDGGGPIIAF